MPNVFQLWTTDFDICMSLLEVYLCSYLFICLRFIVHKHTQFRLFPSWFINVVSSRPFDTSIHQCFRYITMLDITMHMQADLFAFKFWHVVLEWMLRENGFYWFQQCFRVGNVILIGFVIVITMVKQAMTSGLEGDLQDLTQTYIHTYIQS